MGTIPISHPPVVLALLNDRGEETATWAVQARAGAAYSVSVFDSRTGSLACTCADYSYRAGSCAHVEAVKRVKGPRWCPTVIHGHRERAARAESAPPANKSGSGVGIAAAWTEGDMPSMAECFGAGER